MCTPFEFRAAPSHRTPLRLAVVALCLSLAGCGGAPGQRADPQADETNPQLLTATDVTNIMQQAARALNRDMAVAVTDRRGVVLGVGTSGTFALNYAADCTLCPSTQITPDDPTKCGDCSTVNLALQLARTVSFFSADQTPLTSRSVRFISGEHFPPGIKNTGAAALFGIENTNRGCSFDAGFSQGADFLVNKFVPRARNLDSTLLERSGGEALLCQNGVQSAPDSGLFVESPLAREGCTTGIATVPGGVPIYKNGRMAGGIGVALRGVRLTPDPVAAFDSAQILRRTDTNPELQLAEFAARAFAGDNPGFPTVIPKGLPGVCPTSSCFNSGQFLGILPVPAAKLPFDPVIFIDGIEVPEVNGNPPVSGVGSGQPITNFIVNPASLEPPDPNGKCPLPMNQPCPVSSGWLVGPNPSTAGAQPLSQAEVNAIISGGLVSAGKTRAAIRLPLEARTAMVLAVSDTNGALIGLYRMPDATVFSIDVAVAKSRNVIYFSDRNINPMDTLDCPGEGDCRERAFPPGTAITNRTLSFGSQPFFPSGIEATDDTKLAGFPVPYAPGPFRRIFIDDSATPCVNGGLPEEGGQPTNGRQNGIVFFPGSAPLYRDGVLIGGFGVSGDGVEQDDIVTIAGTTVQSPDTGKTFEPPESIRADQVFVRDVRLPYVKFNRQPEQ